jgi:tripartite-type tricarboxylate transporter receptor subunit TctC
VKSGRLKALGVSSAKRTVAMPEVPTIAEATDLKGFDAAAWIGYAAPAPAGTPREILQRLSTEMHRILSERDMQAKLASLGLDPAPSSPEEMQGFLAREQERYAQVIKQANIHID